MAKFDIAEKYFQKLSRDENYRAKLLANPKQALNEEYGYAIDSDITVEVIEQSDDTIVIMLPELPDADSNIDAELSNVTEQVVDLLFVDGIGGYLIPNDKLKWVLRDMRKAQIKKLGLDLSQL